MIDRVEMKAHEASPVLRLFQRLQPFRNRARPFLLHVDDPLGRQREGDDHVGVEAGPQVVEAGPFRLQLQKRPFPLAEEPDDGPDRVELPVQGEAVRQLPRAEPEDVRFLGRTARVYLADDRVRVASVPLCPGY